MTFVFSHRPPQDRPPVCIGVPIDYEHCLHDIHVLAFSIDFEIRLQYGIVQEDIRTISIFRHKYQFRGSPGSCQCLRSCRYLKIPMLWANSTENFRTFWPPSSSLFLIGPVVGLYYLKWYYEWFTCIAWDPIGQRSWSAVTAASGAPHSAPVIIIILEYSSTRVQY